MEKLDKGIFEVDGKEIALRMDLNEVLKVLERTSEEDNTKEEDMESCSDDEDCEDTEDWDDDEWDYTEEDDEDYSDYLKNEYDHLTIETVTIADLIGECRLFFVNKKLKQITFSPTCGQFIPLLSPDKVIHEGEYTRLTREGWCTCVGEGYEHMIEYIEKNYEYNNMEEVRPYRKQYYFEGVCIDIGIERDFEGTYMSIEIE